MFLSLNDKPADDYWSMQIIKDLAEGLDDSYRKLIIIPAEYQDVTEVNEYLQQFDKVLLVVAADEENKFNIDAITHPDIIIYSQFMTDKYDNVDYWLPLGYTPHTRANLPDEPPAKTLDWFFSGQITHNSRRKLVQQLKASKLNGKLVETKGFTQGLAAAEYIDYMLKAKVVPSPAGAVSPESFRFYEALEAGAIPIAESEAYHHALFDNRMPMAVLNEWKRLNDYLSDYKHRPKLANDTMAWWLQQKRAIRQRFKADMGLSDAITVLVPTSYIKSHPSTEIIAETLGTIETHLNADIVIMIDGLRDEQRDKDADYEQYITNLLWLCNKKGYTPYLFREHLHQAEMTRRVLQDVTSSHILYVEHDTPLTPDRSIEWAEIVQTLDEGKADLVRFHFEAMIHPEHKHMMLDDERQDINGIQMMRTCQWSQRPHLARADYYRRILADHFTPDSRIFIEDTMHGICHNEYTVRGKAGWNKHKLWIYTPEGDIKRSYHTDGRAGASKFEDGLIA